MLDYCVSHNIVVEAYSPLRSKLDNETVIKIGKKYGKSPAQILIRWGLQHGIIQIPMSGNITHIKENADVFDFILDEADIKVLNNLNEDLRTSMY